MENSSALQALEQQAKLEYQSAEYLQAAQTFAQVARGYAEAGDAPMAAEMQNNQSVALLRAKDSQAALAVVQDTARVFAEAGDARRQGMALANQASALQALKRYKEAIDCYQESGEVLEKAGEGDLRVYVMQLLSTLFLRRFMFADAVLALQSGLAGVKNPTAKQRLMKKILFFKL